MGTDYTFVCEDCKKYYDIGKDTNALYLMPILLREHEGHNILVFSEHEDGLNVKCKGKYSYPCEDTKTDYVEEMVWDENGLLDKYKDTRYKWNYEEFYNWYSSQSWYEDARFPVKKYTPEEHAERQERTAKSVQKFYETLEDDLEDYLKTDDADKWHLPDSEKDNVLSYDPKDWISIVCHAVKHTDDN